MTFCLNNDGVVVPVYEGTCRHLTETGEHLLINRTCLPEDFESCGAQRSVCPSMYWLIIDGKRYNNMCYCTKCKVMINGSGGNLRTHDATHSARQFTDEDRNKAWILFLIKHNIGLTSLRDPLTRILHPGMTYQKASAWVESVVLAVKRAIQNEVQGRDLVMMVDGWSDQSLRRYLGVAVGFYDNNENRIVYRGVGLIGGGNERHTARNQAQVLTRIMADYRIARRNCSCLVSDSASVNAALAQEMNLDWCPCSVHLWNLIVKNFIGNSPPLLDDLLSRINALRTKSRWVEFMTASSGRRNLIGYCPTRWCSAALCLRSFFENLDHVKAYQVYDGGKSGPVFTDDDVQLVSEVINIMDRFLEANNMLMDADNHEGLASVFEIVNAMYYVLKQRTDGTFAAACQSAAMEIQGRFFNIESKSCCRLMFAGVLNVRHSIPPWMSENLERIAGLLTNEVDYFTGATPPSSARAEPDQRYAEIRSLADMIDDSSMASEQSEAAVQEVREFLQRRSSLRGESFTSFWSHCTSFRHMKMLALALRSLPTNTVWIEQAFSRARRLLSWSRMRLSPTMAQNLWLLNVNMPITEEVSGLGTGRLVVEEEEGVDEESFLDDDELVE